MVEITEEELQKRLQEAEYYGRFRSAGNSAMTKCLAHMKSEVSNGYSPQSELDVFTIIFNQWMSPAPAPAPEKKEDVSEPE
jgi:hypothetical protein